MTPLSISGIAFLFIFSGALAGMLLRVVLPDSHLSENAKDAVRLSMGLIATIAALVLGLLIASAKGSYDSKSNKIKQVTIDIILMDNLLEEYGPETLALRRQLRAVIEPMVDRIWHEKNLENAVPFEANPQSKALYNGVLALAPTNDAQRSIQSRLIGFSTDLAQTRLALHAQARHSIPPPFFAILVFWLAMLFASFSLFIRAEPVVIGALLVSSLAATGALFLILEMDRPFSGVMAIPSEPLRHALLPLGS